MTEIWIDAQLSPALAAWVNRTYDDINAQSVRAVGLRDAKDEEIFQAAREANVIVMSKDSDFLNLLDRYGPPPKVIWVTCGNTSNERMRTILNRTLPSAVQMLEADETIVEIGDL
jgi:predicted nuclease of predicted toxin-antitoxin system